MTKHTYKIYGLLVESEIIIPELIEVLEEKSSNKDTKFDVSIKYAHMPSYIKESISQGEKCSFKKEESWFLIENVAIYRICNGNSIFVENLGGNKHNIKAFILGSSFGCLLIQRDVIAVHGGTILINNSALIITGDTGAGKSTLTSMFRIKGYKFLSDDVSVTNLDHNGDVIVKPAYPQQKLCRDAAIKLGLNIEELVKIDEGRDKFAIPSKEGFICESKRLGYICEVAVRQDDLDKVEIHEILGVDKIKLITKNIYRIEMAKDIGIINEYFKQIVRIAKQTKYFRVVRPKSLFTVDEQIKLIMSQIG